MQRTVSKLMTKDEIIDYVFENFEFFDNRVSLKCEEIGDGNINYVFRILDEDSKKSVVVKQSDILLRSSGRPLDIYRSKIESDVLKMEYDILPNSVPKVYYYDEEKALLVMEDISEYKNLRKELLKGKVYAHLSDNISDFLSKTLISTTDLVLDRHEKKDYVKKFINPELCDISEDLVLTEPYFNYKNRNIVTEGLEVFVEENLYKNERLHIEVLKLKDKFQNYAQSLLHGDLHSGSIFANEEGMKVIDPEFSFYGPMGYDIGNVWGNFVFPIIHNEIKNSCDVVKDLKILLRETIDKTIEKLSIAYDEYVEFEFLKNEGYKNHYISEVIADSFGYAGTEIIRRTVGDSKVMEVSLVENLEDRQKLDRILLNIGISLIINRYKYKTGEDIIRLIDEKVDVK